ncbi:hypothetical protein ACFFX0_26470 [Citricoccus parietis]|uniref:Uncharacterized protein n=1 Tax=Citricoccus parietis TaxID=592307 RepID=A0ABV5G6G0_9MICC
MGRNRARPGRGVHHRARPRWPISTARPSTPTTRNGSNRGAAVPRAARSRAVQPEAVQEITLRWPGRCRAPRMSSVTPSGSGRRRAADPVARMTARASQGRPRCTRRAPGRPSPAAVSSAGDSPQSRAANRRTPRLRATAPAAIQAPMAARGMARMVSHTSARDPWPVRPRTVSASPKGPGWTGAPTPAGAQLPVAWCQSSAAEADSGNSEPPVRAGAASRSRRPTRESPPSSSRASTRPVPTQLRAGVAKAAKSS